ncbi:MAG: hypothetical protein ABIV51_04510 [Saprospiraceae bacterium]
MKKSNSNNVILFPIAFIVLAVLLSSCAHTAPIQACLVDAPYGFWSGLWHGCIAPISFVASLFKDSISVYGVNNNGGWYDFGFVLGSGILFGGGSRAMK